MPMYVQIPEMPIQYKTEKCLLLLIIYYKGFIYFLFNFLSVNAY